MASPPGIALRRALDWLSVTAVGVLIFVALALAAERRLPPGRLGRALLLAMLIVSTRLYLARGQPFVERLIGRRRRSFDTELALFADRAAALQTTPELGRAVDRFLAALSRRLAALIVVDTERVPRLAYSAWGSVPAPPQGGRLLEQLVAARRWVSVHEGPGAGEERDEIQRACVRWGAEYLAPMVEGNELLGIVAIAPSRSGGVADALEFETLERMRVTLTAAVAGVRLYDRLRDLSGELEKKAAARQEALAEALRRLHGAETRLVQGEKLASLGHIVAGVAADLTAQVESIHGLVLPLAEQSHEIARAAEEVARARPDLADARLDEMRRDVAPLVGAIQEGARRAFAIVTDLSGFAETGAVAPNASPAVLHPLLDSTLMLVGTDLGRFEVVRFYDPAVHAVAVAEGPLGQVVLNLVLNALQAMGQGGTLTLSTRIVDGLAEISITDTGGGIRPEVMPRIFEPFFSTKGPTKGTGLGLSVSYRIVERHGGRIVVESELGAGSTFRVRLPCAETAADAPPDPSLLRHE